MVNALNRSIALAIGLLAAVSASGRDAVPGAKLTDVRAARERYRDERLQRETDELAKRLRNAGVEKTDDRLSVTFSVPAFFAFDSAEINPAVKGDLVVIARTASDMPGATVRVEGYAPAVGSLPYNRELSQRRAEAVAAFLVDYGVPSGRVDAVGHGEEAEEPVSAGDQPDLRIALTAPEPPPAMRTPAPSG